MLNLMLLALGIAAADDAREPIFVVDNQPSVRISLAPYDLRMEAGVEAVRRRIRGAANRVCVQQGVRDTAMYLETVACVKTAITNGNRQLGEAIASRRSASPLVASIAITGPSK